MKTLGTVVFCGVLTVLAAVSPVVAADQPFEKHPGYVDGSAFSELAGERTTTVEVALSGALLRALMSMDPELKELGGELQSIHAVVLEPERGDGKLLERGRELMRATEKQLLGRGWSRITRIKDQGAEVSVLVLSTERAIEGLVALVAGDEGELVFANIAGNIDLAAIAALGEKLDIPGLKDVVDDE